MLVGMWRYSLILINALLLHLLGSSTALAQSASSGAAGTPGGPPSIIFVAGVAVVLVVIVVLFLVFARSQGVTPATRRSSGNRPAAPRLNSTLRYLAIWLSGRWREQG